MPGAFATNEPRHSVAAQQQCGRFAPVFRRRESNDRLGRTLRAQQVAGFSAPDL